jgi:hypothetical protein
MVDRGARPADGEGANYRFLIAGTPSSHGPWFAVVVKRLRELGWIEGRNLVIEYRWAEGHKEHYSEIATEFVRLRVDVIVTTSPAVPAAKQATSVIPIVFALAGDPVGTGVVASLARPGGNPGQAPYGAPGEKKFGSGISHFKSWATRSDQKKLTVVAGDHEFPG